MRPVRIFFLALGLLFSQQIFASFSHKIFRTVLRRMSFASTKLPLPQPSLTLGLFGLYDYHPPQDRISKEEFPAIRRVGYETLSNYREDLETFCSFSEYSDYKSFDSRVKEALMVAEHIVMNCEGLDHEQFTPTLSVMAGTITNFELTYLFMQSLKGAKSVNITWITGPENQDWQSEPSNQKKFESWWAKKSSAPKWCHPQIQKKLKRYFKKQR